MADKKQNCVKTVETKSNVENTSSSEVTGIESPTQLSSYSDYSYLVTPLNNNPDALIFDQTLPGLTQGKRLTSTSATLSLDGGVDNDNKSSKRLSLNDSSKLDTEKIITSLSKRLQSAQEAAGNKQMSEQLGNLPSSSYQNQDANPTKKPVTKYSSRVSNNNNQQQSKTSISSKATDASQFYYHRNLGQLPQVKEENVPIYVTDKKKSDSDAASEYGSDDKKAEEKKEDEKMKREEEEKRKEEEDKKSKKSKKGFFCFSAPDSDDGAKATILMHKCCIFQFKIVYYLSLFVIEIIKSYIFCRRQPCS